MRDQYSPYTRSDSPKSIGKDRDKKTHERFTGRSVTTTDSWAVIWPAKRWYRTAVPCSGWYHIVAKSIGKDGDKKTHGFLGQSVTTTESRAVTWPAKRWTAVVSWMVGRYVLCTGWYQTSRHPSYAEEWVSEAMVQGLGMTFELGPAYCCPKVWKCCSLAAAHTHTKIATHTNGTVQVVYM